MADENDGPMWPPNMFKGFQQAGETAVEQQQEMLQQLFAASQPNMGMGQLGAMSQLAMFKTRVQSGGRISIPDAEREALDIAEGDIVQTVVIPVKRNTED
jgi:hypothetical protein